MNPKNYIRAILNCDLNRQERMFRLLVMLGLIGLLAGIVSRTLTGGNIRHFIIMMIVFAALCCISYYFIHFKEIQLGAVIIAFFITFLVLPFNFFTGGGIYGGSPIWFLFGVMYVCLVVEGKIKYFLFVSAVGLSAVCYYIAYSYPDLVSQHTLAMAYVDSFSTLSIVTAFSCF